MGKLPHQQYIVLGTLRDGEEEEEEGYGFSNAEIPDTGKHW